MHVEFYASLYLAAFHRAIFIVSLVSVDVHDGEAAARAAVYYRPARSDTSINQWLGMKRGDSDAASFSVLSPTTVLLMTSLAVEPKRAMAGEHDGRA